MPKIEAVDIGAPIRRGDGRAVGDAEAATIELSSQRECGSVCSDALVAADEWAMVLPTFSYSYDPV